MHFKQDMGSAPKTKKARLTFINRAQLEERVGFEPTVPYGTPDFESGTFDHSATSPIRCAVVYGVARHYSSIFKP